MDNMLFKDLPEEKQREAIEQLRQGEFLYGLSPEDDTHIKFAVMLAIKQLRALKSEEYDIIIPFEIGADKKGLFVSYALNKDIDDTLQ